MRLRSLVVGAFLLGISAAATAEDVVWTNPVGVSVSGNSLTKTGSNNAFDAGASSLNVLQDGYGYVEFTATETTTHRLCGLSNGDSDQNYTDVDYGILLRNDTTLAVYESGNYRGDFGNYAAGDRLRVEVAHGTVKYRKNGQVFLTSSVPPRFPLRVDSALYSPGATLTNVRMGGTVWINETGVAISENTLTKTNGAGWTAGAASANEIVSGDAFVEFTATETNTSRLAGLSADDSGTSAGDVDFAIHLLANGTLEVLEDGASSGGLGSYGSGDRLRVELRGGVVRYFKNSSLLFTSSASPTYPLRVDTALETPAATLTDVVVSGVVWTDQVGLAVTGSTLRKTAGDGWNASAASTNQIASGDGFAEFTAVETNTRRTFGLNSGTSSVTYSDIDFAIDLSAGGIVEIFENGLSKGQFGSYVSGDRFRVEVSGGAVVYRRNETVLHTSSNAPQYPLHADAALYTSGATVANVVVGELVWTNIVGLQPLGTGLMRTSSGTGWSAGAASTKTIDTGYFAFTAGVPATSLVAGLGQGDTDQNYTDVDFGILLRSDGSVAVYEAGNYRGDFGSYTAGDRFRVAYSSNVVTYSRNGAVFHSTSGVSPTLPLRADTSFYQVPTLLLNGVLSESLDQVDTPSFSPAGGAYSSAQTVTITCVTSGAVIRYTTDGTEPTTSSTIYSTPVSVSVSQTLKAKAWATGLAPSNVGSATYTLTLPDPGLSPGSGTYAPSLTVTISSSVSGAELHYTVNGNDPTLSDPAIASGGTIVLDSSTTVKAKAWKTGWTTSGVAAASYTLKVATPALNPAGGSYSAAQNVTVTTSTTGATIHFTTNGAEPTEADPTVASGSTVPVTRSSVLKAAAWRTGAVQSDTAAATYWLNLGTATAPVLTPPPGTYTAAQTVTVTAQSGATIRYTMDGTEPTFWSAKYSVPLSVATTTVLKVKAFQVDMTPSASAGGLYRIDLGTVDAPRFSPGGGSYAAAQEIAIASETAGATIHYTTNGLEPLETDPVIQAGQTVRVDQDLMLRARAWKTGMPVSAVTSASYAVTGAVAAGRSHSLALKSDGRVWTWGSNAYGELGDPAAPINTNRLSPGVVPGLSDVIAIAAGSNFSVAVKRDGTAWGWGLNSLGQLGNGGPNTATPVPVSGGLTNVAAISAGESHVVVIKNDGAVWEWGADGLTWYGYAPVQVAGLAGITKLAAGFRHSLALKTDGMSTGSAWAWGANSWGDLGDGTLNSHAQPMPVALPTDVTAIAGGYTHSVAVRNNDTVWAWGSNGSGGLGDGTNTMRLSPVQSSGISGALAISAGQGFSLALKADSSLWSWGDSGYGTLGTGDPNFSFVPVKNVVFSGLAVSAHGTGNHALGLKADGSVWVWGNNYNGQLGDGTTNMRTFPVPIPDFSLRRSDLLSLDTDGDGIPNVVEDAIGTDPRNGDTNGDGIPDAQEIAAGKSATNNDMDGDGVSNADELARGTDPFRADTDGDGVPDGQDCFPLDPTRWQCPAADPNDHTPPIITLEEPTDATLLPPP